MAKHPYRVHRDLREFLDDARRNNLLQSIDGAHWDLEIGGLTELSWERGGPALLYDHIPGSQPGFRVATNLTDTLPRACLAIGLEPDSPRQALIDRWMQLLSGYRGIPPVEASDAPFLMNRQEADEVDVTIFPAPKWHEQDGGRYIGTGDVVITRDPDTGWVNLGVYRVVVHDRKTLGLYCSPGQHARIIREKYWSRGEPCPIALTLGQSPTMMIAAAQKLGWGESEYEFAGYLAGRPQKIVHLSRTGLPVPACAEIVIEGTVPPLEVESRPEGPFGEASGYYATNPHPEAVVRIEAVYHRDDPIVVGEPPFRPPSEGFYGRPEIRSAKHRVMLERAGVPDVRDVVEMGGAGGFTIVSLKQRSPSHAMEVALLLCRQSYKGGWIVTVDDDVDPWNIEEVLWAIATRCDPDRALQTVGGLRSSLLDPKLSPARRASGDLTASVVLVNACRPYHWAEEFPAANRMSETRKARMLADWAATVSQWSSPKN